MSGKRLDEATGTETMGHEWDGIEELNTPLPSWWLYTFYACIIFAIGYAVVYPSIPGLTEGSHGTFGWTSRGQLAGEMDAAKAARAPILAAIDATPLEDLPKNPDLMAKAVAGGKAAFKVNCVPCHGAAAQGNVGYPNLNDDDWLWGGTLDQIMQTIQFGARSGNPKAHEGQMLAFGRDGVLKKDEIVTVANYVRSLSGLSTAPKFDAAAGKKIFAENCTSCHGEDGKGNQEVGAPNLTDKIWLYGSDEDTLVETITNGRAGVMPAWVGRLDPVTVKAMAVYVHSLGGGK